MLNLLSDKERAVLTEVQRLPLTQKPFVEIANRLNMNEEEVLKVCNNLLEKGIIRRFGPSISHRKIGFNANPLTVVKVPEDRINELGLAIAEEPDVTHCYARSGWEYNLFFMIHSKTREESLQRLKSIVTRSGNFDYRFLFSLKEFKKKPFEIPREEKKKQKKVVK